RRGLSGARPPWPGRLHRRSPKLSYLTWRLPAPTIAAHSHLAHTGPGKSKLLFGPLVPVRSQRSVLLSPHADRPRLQELRSSCCISSLSLQSIADSHRYDDLSYPGIVLL